MISEIATKICTDPDIPVDDAFQVTVRECGRELAKQTLALGLGQMAGVVDVLQQISVGRKLHDKKRLLIRVKHLKQTHLSH